MKISSANYVVGATNTSNFPTMNLPEFMLCGRSNVGKSTFINTIFNNKYLAKTSSKPGKTQVLNWFLINDCFCIVDAPGYGYAKVSKSQKEAFGIMIEDYLVNREELKAVFQLIDYRHQPTEDDVLMYNFLKYYNIDVYFILTKEDKVKKNDLKKNLNIIMKTLDCYDNDKFIPVSSVNRNNIDKVLNIIDTYL
ncbi:MAG: ribosome biogenesis GTP-binding protein YihA/YsxC [Bacilli bacterium]|jgi:GTP-binding protein|nr:ribosome biogenesis GTP-binding protein YihA/YsxC [Bacilli bacterium]